MKKQFCLKKAYKFIGKKDREPFSKICEAKKDNTLIEKTILFQKSLQIHRKKGHRTVFQNMWSQKRQHSHWKNNSVSKKLTNSYEKSAQNRLPKCLKPKKQTLSLKKQFFKKAYKLIWKNATEPLSKMPKTKKTNTLVEKTIVLQKSLQIHMKKVHKTVFQNAWSQKNQHSHWKNNFASKKLTNSYEKSAQNRLPKCLKQKKTLSLKKQFFFKKAYKFIWKNATEPLSKMPKTKKNTIVEKTILLQKTVTNSYEKRQQNRFPKCLKPKKTSTPIEKTILLKKTLQIHIEKSAQNRLPKCLKQKNKHSYWKNNSVSKKFVNSYRKKCTKPSSKMPEAKKTNILIEKTILFQKSL